MIRDLLRYGYQFAKRTPLLRKIVRHPTIARIKAGIATSLMVGDPQYERWLTEYLMERRERYGACTEPGLLSFLTTVWNTPVKYLRVLTESLLNQATAGDFEWVVLDNGTTDSRTREYLAQVIATHPRVKFIRVEQNLGIVGGMRFCLEHAAGRYVLPLDSDDYLYPDCVAVLTRFLQDNDYPALAYSDEDHLLGKKPIIPYFKPDWDPVLCLNSAYIAHLGAIDRRFALELNVYGDAHANGCHDWDTFLKFVSAGHTPRHIPEMLYSWRMHGRSTAANVNSKSDIHQSHRAVLQAYINRQPHADRYALELSPLFGGTPDWWIRRRHVEPRPLLSVVLCDRVTAGGRERVLKSCDYPDHRAIEIPVSTRPEALLRLLEAENSQNGLVALVSDRVQIENDEWPWEALCLMELHPETAIVGGRIQNSHGKIVDAGQYLGFGGGCGCPDVGRTVHDSGYFAQMWKQRSVSAVPSQFCVFDGAFLREVLNRIGRRHVSLPFLGAWAGAHALAARRRVVYSPFLSATSDDDWARRVTTEERAEFMAVHRHLPPDTRYYSRWLNREMGSPYRPGPLHSADAAETQPRRAVA